MEYRFFTCDVFTRTRFGGNPLAVLPDARGLTTLQMQQIAREFNYSESTFVLPAEAGGDRRVRIFTPTTEVPFAGHPNVGTAFVLASAGEFGAIGDAGREVLFEEQAGPVPVRIARGDGGALYCELTAPQALTLGATAGVPTLAQLLGLAERDIDTSLHPPRVASVGLPFLMVRLANRKALGRARVADMAALEALRAAGIVPDLHLYVTGDDDYDLRCRMFAPLDGVPEDPATGSANAALAAMLASLDERDSGEFNWRIAQGVEMGRPSEIVARCCKTAEGITTWIGGYSVPISEGSFRIG